MYNPNVDIGKSEDLTGRRFGRLTVLGPAYKKSDYKLFWLCQCSCGGLTIVISENLKYGNTSSCGCVQIAWAESIINRTQGRQERMQKEAEQYLEQMMEH